MPRKTLAGLGGSDQAVPRVVAFAAGHEAQAESSGDRGTAMLSLADLFLGELLMDTDIVETPQRALQDLKPRNE
jgi:hypothetical protein